MACSPVPHQPLDTRHCSMCCHVVPFWAEKYILIKFRVLKGKMPIWFHIHFMKKKISLSYFTRVDLLRFTTLTRWNGLKKFYTPYPYALKVRKRKTIANKQLIVHEIWCRKKLGIKFHHRQVQESYAKCSWLTFHKVYA